MAHGRLPQRRGKRGTVDLDHDVVPTRAEPMDGLGDEFFSGVGFAKDEHGGVRGRDLLHLASTVWIALLLPTKSSWAWVSLISALR